METCLNYIRIILNINIRLQPTATEIPSIKLGSMEAARLQAPNPISITQVRHELGKYNFIPATS